MSETLPEIVVEPELPGTEIVVEPPSPETEIVVEPELPAVDVIVEPPLPEVEVIFSEIGLPGREGPSGPAGPQGADGLSDTGAVTLHIEDPTPHPAYDDGPSFLTLYRNAKV